MREKVYGWMDVDGWGMDLDGPIILIKMDWIHSIVFWIGFRCSKLIK